MVDPQPKVRQFRACAENAAKYGLEWKRDRDRYRTVLAELVPTLPNALASPLCECERCKDYRAAVARARDALNGAVR